MAMLKFANTFTRGYCSRVFFFRNLWGHVPWQRTTTVVCPGVSNISPFISHICPIHHHLFTIYFPYITIYVPYKSLYISHDIPINHHMLLVIVIYPMYLMYVGLDHHLQTSGVTPGVPRHRNSELSNLFTIYCP